MIYKQRDLPNIAFACDSSWRGGKKRKSKVRYFCLNAPRLQQDNSIKKTCQSPALFDVDVVVLLNRRLQNPCRIQSAGRGNCLGLERDIWVGIWRTIGGGIYFLPISFSILVRFLFLSLIEQNTILVRWAQPIPFICRRRKGHPVGHADKFSSLVNIRKPLREIPGSSQSADILFSNGNKKGAGSTVVK